MTVESLEDREYRRATSIKEASSLLAEEDAVLISGGQSLMPLLRQGMIDTSLIVDISHIDDYNEISVDENELHVGGLVTHRELIESDLSGTPWQALASTAKEIGDRQVRNWGTVGGAVAHGDPSLDYPPTMAVLDTQVEVTDGERVDQMAIEDVYVAPFTTALDTDQIVVGIRVPRPSATTGVQFEKFSWRKGDMSLVNAAARVTTDGSGEITEVRLCIGSVVPRPTRLPELEQELVGADADDQELQTEIAGAVPEYTEPVGEAHASVAYKNRIATNLTEKALHTASRRAQEATQ